MLSFRRETEYAVQLLRTLAKSKTEKSLKEISDEIGVSFLFLQKIARKLRQAKLVTAEKGSNGGYRLSVAASKLSLRKIIAITETECELLPCCAEKFSCPKNKGCLLKGKVSKVNMALNNMLDKIKLNEL